MHENVLSLVASVAGKTQQRRSRRTGKRVTVMVAVIDGESRAGTGEQVECSIQNFQIRNSG